MWYMTYVAESQYLTHRRSQDFVCGGALFCKKSWRPFFSRRRLNIPPYLSHPAKLLKLTLALAGGCTSCPAGCTFSCKLGLKKIFFTALGVQVHPLHPLPTPMIWSNYRYVFDDYEKVVILTATGNSKSRWRRGRSSSLRSSATWQ